MPKKASTRKAATETVANEQEVRLLEKGFTPDETKLGTPFKGKNKVVIA
jgi:hypothetical protein